MKELEFKFGGIDFLVYVDVTSGGTVKDSIIESVIGVHVWDEKDRKYIPITCDFDAFEHDFSDQIQEAFEDMLENERLAYEDMLYESAREREYGL